MTEEQQTKTQNFLKKGKYHSFHLFMPEKQYFIIKKHAKKNKQTMSKYVRNIIDQCVILIVSKNLLDSQNNTARKYAISKSFVMSKAEEMIRKEKKLKSNKNEETPRFPLSFYNKRRVSLKKETRFCIRMDQYELLCEYEFVNHSGSKAEILRDTICQFLRLLAWTGEKECKHQIKSIKHKFIKKIKFLYTKNIAIHKKLGKRIYQLIFDIPPENPIVKIL